jgi:hypothetical protein
VGLKGKEGRARSKVNLGKESRPTPKGDGTKRSRPPVAGGRGVLERMGVPRVLCARTRWGKPGEGIGYSTGANRQKGRNP